MCPGTSFTRPSSSLARITFKARIIVLEQMSRKNQSINRRRRRRRHCRRHIIHILKASHGHDRLQIPRKTEERVPRPVISGSVINVPV